MDQLEHIKDLCRRMEDLTVDAGIPPFDRVRLTTGAGGDDELWFLWEERKLCVVVALTDGPDDLTAALTRATAGDPVLN